MLGKIFNIALILFIGFGCSYNTAERLQPDLVPLVPVEITNKSSMIYKSSFHLYDKTIHSNVQKALAIVVRDLDKASIYKKEDMIGLLNNKKIDIVFTDGIKDKSGSRCIYSDTKHLKGQCLSGYYDGKKKIMIIRYAMLCDSSFAHEMYHYFQHYLGGGKSEKHHPKRIWKRLFGYKVKDSKGSVNDSLKAVGL